MDPAITLPAAVIFDFDGLLMDTESTMFESWRFEWSQWGLKLDPRGFFANHGGDITEDRYDALAAAVGRRYDRALSHARRTEYRDRLHEDLDVGEGLRGWIREARETGIQVAIASYKPHPDIYRLALSRLGAAPDRSVAVEDTPHGVQAAQSAGLACIAIPNPFVPPDAVALADLVLSSAGAMPLMDALEQCQRGRAQRRRRT